MQPREMRRAWRQDIRRRAVKKRQPQWETETGHAPGLDRNERYTMETETNTLTIDLPGSVLPASFTSAELAAIVEQAIAYGIAVTSAGRCRCGMAGCSDAVTR